LRLLDTHRQQLLPALAKAGPVELPRLLPAFAAGQNPELGQALLETLQQSSAARALRPEDVLATLTNYPPPLLASASTWLDSLRTDSATDRRRLDQLLAELQTHTGDIRRGQALFNSERAACASCHRIGYLGGDLGPDLTTIGTIRTDRDLLEAIVFPSASFVRSYEPWTVTTPDGDDVTGVLRRDTSSEIVLATGPGTESRIPREHITDLQPATLSTMPAGLDEQLTRQELADLLTFLRNTRWGAH
jgi:putative heme-binding domain-containing protein